MIYLDNASTTKVFPKALETFEKVSKEFFFNSSSLYATKEREILTEAKEVIAKEIGATADEIYFCSGGTEANNLAVFGGVKNKIKLVLSSEGEHPSVYESIKSLIGKGFNVKFAPLTRDTSVYSDKLVQLAGKDCGFISLIHASNETGTINDISEFFSRIKNNNPKVITHSDGVQAFLKIPVNVKELGVDLYSISAHKIGGVKGVGVLYIKKGVHINPIILGGGQERGIRSGTENIAGIVAFSEAVKEYKRFNKSSCFQSLRDIFLQKIKEESEKVKVCSFVVNNASNTKNQLTNILSLSIIGIQAEVLQRILADKDKIFIGLGTACSSNKKGNRVLQASGRTVKEIAGNIRISFGIETKAEEVIEAANKIVLRAGELLENR